MSLEEGSAVAVHFSLTTTRPQRVHQVYGMAFDSLSTMRPSKIPEDGTFQPLTDGNDRRYFLDNFTLTDAKILGFNVEGVRRRHF